MSSAPHPVVVGLDVGTTGVKAVAFGIDTPWRYIAVREYPLLQVAPGQQVQDPAEILAATHAALVECIAGAAGASVVAISLSAAMHGLIALDDRYAPITPLVTWADGRAGLEAAELALDPGALDLQEATGTPLHPMTPLAKLEWFRRHDPDTYSTARWWIGLKDYLLYWLTGTLATETSSASGTGLLGVVNRAWNPLALAACGMEERRLPEILPTTAVLPLRSEIAASLGVAAGTPVAVGAADGPLANLGSGAVDPGVAGLSLGTSGAIRVLTEGPRPDRLGRVFCYALVEPLWVAGGAISNGAEVLRWAARHLAPPTVDNRAGRFPESQTGRLPDDRTRRRPENQTGRLPDKRTGLGEHEDTMVDPTLGVAEDSDGVVMLPFLLAERAPLWAPDLAAAFIGLRHHHGETHMRRAAIEGVCVQMRLLLERVDAVHPVSSLRATGGAFRSPMWRRLMAAALERPMTVAGDEEGTALGAAAVGLLAVGYSGSLTEALATLSGLTGDNLRAEHIDPSTVATFRDLRARTAVLVDALARNVSSH